MITKKYSKTKNCYNEIQESNVTTNTTNDIMRSKDLQLSMTQTID